MTSKIEQMYTRGVQDALEKVAMGGFGDMLKSMGQTVSSALKNPNKAKVEAASQSASTGNLGGDITRLLGNSSSKGSVPTSTAPTGG